MHRGASICRTTHRLRSISDGSSFDWELEKQILPHERTFAPKQITSLTMHDMKKADDPSPFPALTQLEVYGHET